MTRLVAMLAVSTMLALPVAVMADTRVAIPGGTSVPIRMVDSISSGSAEVGDSFEFKAEDDVVVNGWVVISRGAEGRGEVTSVERAGGNGHPGKLGIKFDYIYASDGEKVRLTDVKKTKEGEDSNGASSTATIATYALLGPLGLFAHNLVKGHNLTIDSSKPFTVFVDDTVHVVAKQRGAKTSDGFAH